MSGYMKDAIHKFQHPTPTRPQNSPHQWIATNYGSTAPQMAHSTHKHPDLQLAESKNVQQVVGKFLYYACAVDPTMIVTINSIASKQNKTTQATEKKVVQLLNYAATHSASTACYHFRGIILHIHSEASFLSAPVSKSRAGGITI